MIEQLQSLIGQELHINKEVSKITLKGIRIHQRAEQKFTLLCQGHGKLVEISSFYIIAIRNNVLFLSIDETMFIA